MSGEELKQYIKDRGLSMEIVAEELDTSLQNLNGKLKAKSLKSDFLTKVKEIIDRCCPPLPAEMGKATVGANINGNNSPNKCLSQKAGRDAAFHCWRQIN